MTDLERAEQAQHRVLALALAEVRGDVDAMALLVGQACSDLPTAELHLRSATGVLIDAVTAVLGGQRELTEDGLMHLLDGLIADRTDQR